MPYILHYVNIKKKGRNHEETPLPLPCKDLHKVAQIVKYAECFILHV